MKFASSWMDAGVEQAFASLRAKVTAPLSIELWDGRVFAFGSGARVRMKLPTAAALKHLVHPTLGSLAEAYVEGHLDIEGSLRDMARAADQLADNAGASVWQRAATAAGRHTRGIDRDHGLVEVRQIDEVAAQVV